MAVYPRHAGRRRGNVSYSPYSRGQAAESRSETFDYPSLYENLGKAGKWVAIAANLIILYGLLTAYFTGGAAIAASFLTGTLTRL